MHMTLSLPDRSRAMEEKSWWDTWNTSYRTQEDNDEISSELFARAAAIINEILQAGGGRVLEVACGAGTLSRKLKYSSYHGLDLSPAAIELARRKAGMPLVPGAVPPAYEAADFHDAPLFEEPFDVVVCIDAISSFRDQQLAMNKMTQSLRKGGHLVLTTINRFVYDRIRRTQNVRLESGPVRHWLTRGELRHLIKHAGLKIEHFSTIMPRGNLGILRVINSRRLNEALGASFAATLRCWKESAGLGQYSVVVARKTV
jgi:2-polyprenyl-3-methyl-5-hydroxy-6-metoxy-1,4-benzoquinol methylase